MSLVEATLPVNVPSSIKLDQDSSVTPIAANSLSLKALSCVCP